jgi:hypothetical protein
MRDDSGMASTRAGDEAAEALGLTALAYLLEDDDRAVRFLTATGIDGARLSTLLHDPVFLGCVLDFVLEDEALLLAVSATAGLRADRVAGIRRRLPGFQMAD